MPCSKIGGVQAHCEALRNIIDLKHCYNTKKAPLRILRAGLFYAGRNAYLTTFTWPGKKKGLAGACPLAGSGACSAGAAQGGRLDLQRPCPGSFSTRVNGHDRAEAGNQTLLGLHHPKTTIKADFLIIHFEVAVALGDRFSTI